MTLEEAANAIVWWLIRQGIALASEVFGRELELGVFRIGIVQALPVPKRRVFEVLPTEVADCYEVKEVG